MKKLATILLIGIVSVTLFGCGDPCKDSFLTRMGDSLATLGKKGIEKDRILVERQAERAAACTKAKAKEMKQNMGF